MVSRVCKGFDCLILGSFYILCFLDVNVYKRQVYVFFFLMIREPPRSTLSSSSAASDVYKRQREVGCGDFIKIEVIHDSKYLLPDNYETIKATEILAKEGFVVMPYMYPDLNAARDLANAGAAAIMPLGSPIGSNKGILSLIHI